MVLQPTHIQPLIKFAPIDDLQSSRPVRRPAHFAQGVARPTYATRCLDRGIRLEVVAKLLGHSTTRITQHYAKLLQNNILNEIKDAFEKPWKEHGLGHLLSKIQPLM